MPALPQLPRIPRGNGPLGVAQLAANIPPEAGFYRQGVNRDKGEIALSFNFPQTAAPRYASLLDGLSAATGWQLAIHPEANQSALVSKVYDILPPEWEVLKAPSLHREKGLVAVNCDLPEGAVTAEVANLFQETTGYGLLVKAGPAAPSPWVSIPAGSEQMEINRVYAIVREELTAAGARVYKAGLKNKAIEASFITPQVGRRHLDTLRALSRKTGWPVKIKEDLNQNEVKNLVKRLVPHEWALIREPGFHQDAAQVRVRLGAQPAADDPRWHDLVETVRKEAGYELVFDPKAEILTGQVFRAS